MAGDVQRIGRIWRMSCTDGVRDPLTRRVDLRIGLQQFRISLSERGSALCSNSRRALTGNGVSLTGARPATSLVFTACALAGRTAWRYRAHPDASTTDLRAATLPGCPASLHQMQPTSARLSLVQCAPVARSRPAGSRAWPTSRRHSRAGSRPRARRCCADAR